MAPPFLAYYAVYKNDEALLRETIRQVGLYREVLKKSNGLWTHIKGPNSPDPGSWSTGNAWAAAGITRVLATVIKAPMSKGWTTEINLLKSYIKEILDAAMTIGQVSDRRLIAAVGNLQILTDHDTNSRKRMDCFETTSTTRAGSGRSPEQHF